MIIEKGDIATGASAGEEGNWVQEFQCPPVLTAVAFFIISRSDDFGLRSWLRRALKVSCHSILQILDGNQQSLGSPCVEALVLLLAKA